MLVSLQLSCVFTVKGEYSFCFQMDNSDAVVDLVARIALHKSGM